MTIVEFCEIHCHSGPPLRSGSVTMTTESIANTCA